MRVYSGIVVALLCFSILPGWAETTMSAEEMDRLRGEAFELYSSGDEYADQDRAFAIMTALAEQGDRLAKVWVDPTWHRPRPSGMQRTMNTQPYPPLRDEQIAEMKVLSDAGNAQAQYMMALAYSMLRATPPEGDKEEIFRLLELSGEQGFPLSMQLLGSRYYQKTKRACDGDFSQALKWYRKAAELGNSRAMYSLGMLYYRGKDVQQDYKKAIVWLTKGAESGYTISMNHLWHMHVYSKGISGDYAVALKWIREAQKRGNTTSMSYLGIMYANGFGVEQNTEQAIDWYTQSAEAGNIMGMIKLAKMYEEGTIVEQDDLKAMKWYRRADSAHCRFNPNKREKLATRIRIKAIRYYIGEDIEKNHPYARELFEEALRTQAKAQLWCALFYATGDCSFPKDEEKARTIAKNSIESIKKEAATSVIESQYLLGMAYYHGLGVAYDWDKAKDLFERAAQEDYALAQTALDEYY